MQHRTATQVSGSSADRQVVVHCSCSCGWADQAEAADTSRALAAATQLLTAHKFTGR